MMKRVHSAPAFIGLPYNKWTDCDDMVLCLVFGEVRFCHASRPLPLYRSLSPPSSVHVQFQVPENADVIGMPSRHY